METINLLYVMIILFYCLSVLGYFIDFMQNSQKVNRAAFWLLSIVWVLQLVFLIIRYIQFDRLPIMTLFEGMFFYAWIIVTISLVVNRLYRTDFLVFVINIIGFSVMAISMLTPAGDVSERLAELFIFELLVIHVVVLMLSYGVFTLGFAFSILYVLQHQMLKQKKWNNRMVRTGNLLTLLKGSYVCSLIGFPLMLTGLILGLVYAWVSMEAVPFTDMKVISSFFVLLVYGVYLFYYKVKDMRGYQMALFHIGAFLILLINYLLSSTFSQFHFW
ncbi:cytochrome C assembly family protein [Salisediminibacterium halotolerans]|uniref:HemX protein n=1 Tax=Salisediminibacterium halotolerans TaxID=517425 RepID=A0A1H9U3W3_9BACI|nr:cytochrome c biogenesis protein CcsA [Salisediminibacterium haloalkalitolerans]SES03854.1 HemX protein [Salisediminibacterium haloalkalitolerans]